MLRGKLDPQIRENWEKIDKWLPILLQASKRGVYDPKIARHLISLYADIESRTTCDDERTRARDQIKWLQGELKRHETKQTEESGNSSEVKLDASIPAVSYDDIGGLKNEINEIREVVELPLRYPEIYEHLGIVPPRGILLKGPSGCGKTLLAQAVAHETKAHFLLINAPEVMSKFYGESEKDLRAVFNEAAQKAPSIIFIDEIDALAPKRDQVNGEVEKRMVAQLLVLMNGIKRRGQVIVIGATNLPDSLDSALRRPGRFDREIEIGPPNFEGRLEILGIYIKRMPVTTDVDIQAIARKTDGFSGAQLEAVCREAGCTTIRRCKPELINANGELSKVKLDNLTVTMDDFESAIQKVSGTTCVDTKVYTDISENGLSVSWDRFIEEQRKEQTQNVR